MWQFSAVIADLEGLAQGCSRKDDRGASEGELLKEGGASSSGRKVALS